MTIAQKTNDAGRWKRKYTDAVREFDAREAAWRTTETRLQKNLLKLIFGFVGTDPALDATLKSTQANLKKATDPRDRAQIIDRAVAAVIIATGDARQRTDDPRPGETLLQVLRALRVPAAYEKEAELLASRLSSGDAAALPDNIERVIDMLNDALDSHDSPRPGVLSDTFVEFLNRISLGGSIGEKVAELKKRSSRIKTELERLMVIDDTIALLTNELDEDAARDRSAKEARTIVRELIEWMTLPSHVAEDLKAIQEQLESAATEDEMSGVLRDLGRTVSQFHGNLMSELSDVEYYLKNIAIRLKELQLGIEQAFQDQQDSIAEQTELAQGISHRIDDISETLRDENDLDAVKTLIEQGFAEISTKMQQHLALDKRRVTMGERRLKKLSERIKRMDEESTRLRAQVRRERERAHQDALTGIANRAAFDEHIAAEIARFKRHRRALSLAVIDIDRFKSINDEFGHKAGDKVLKNVAQICAEKVRASDFLARYGGEEFVLILPETTLEQALRVAEKLRGEIEGKGFYYDDRRVPISVSVGVSMCREEDCSDSVFQRADDALYVAKERGRNRCVTEDDL